MKGSYKAHKCRLNFRKPMNIHPWKDVFLTCQAISTMGNFLHKNSCYGLPCTRKRVFCYFKNKTREYLAQLEMKHNLVKFKYDSFHFQEDYCCLEHRILNMKTARNNILINFVVTSKGYLVVYVYGLSLIQLELCIRFSFSVLNFGSILFRLR